MVGSLEINWLTPTKIRETLVLGERGLFRLDDLTQDLYFYENAQSKDMSWPAYASLKGVSEGSMNRYAVPRFEPKAGWRLSAHFEGDVGDNRRDGCAFYHWRWSNPDEHRAIAL
jgi:hypothetical protein